MAQRIRVLAPLLAAMVAVGLAVVPSGVRAGSAALTYPNDCATLQGCIQHVATGGVVRIATNVLVKEDVVIHKSLSLRSASGHAARVRSIFIASETHSVDVTVRDLTVTRGLVAAFGGSAGGHHVSLSHLHAIGPDVDAVEYDTTVPGSFTLVSSLLETTGGEPSSQDALSLNTHNTSGLATVRVVANRLVGHADTSTENGIELDVEGDARLKADILNNTIWDFGTCNCGGPSNILVDMNTSTTVADVNIVGNTLDTAANNDLEVRNDLLAGGLLKLDVFDNILSRAGSGAISLEEEVPGTLVYRAGNNDEYANGSPDDLLDKEPGTDNLIADPLFLDPLNGDFRLGAGSDLIDAGVTCSPGGVAQPDVAGHARLAGFSVDMGSSEFDAGPPTGRVALGGDGPDNLVGTMGRDILCGYAGSDTLNGKQGGDVLAGGKGPDHLIGGPGPDAALGGPGNDTICLKDGVDGNDFGDGGDGNDDVRADPADAVLNAEGFSTC